MPAERYYTPQALAIDGTISLTEGEHHHLLHVMRTAVGDTVEIVNGRGQLAVAEVLSAGKRESTLKILETQQSPPPPFALILAQALPRLNRLDTIVEKATELGITELWLFPGDRSERKILQESQKNRVLQVAVSAMKQCGALWLPEIKWQQPINGWKKGANPLLFGDVNPEAIKLGDYLQKHPLEGGVVFVTGPEAGFSEREVADLAALEGVGVKLHHNILRTDTASIVALSLLSTQ
jgi:16S rRNA (uracil1498-N3)-methyltransferase